MRFLTLLFVVLLAASCSIQKRHYRPGFFVQGFRQDKAAARTFPENEKKRDTSVQQHGVATAEPGALPVVFAADTIRPADPEMVNPISPDTLLPGKKPKKQLKPLPGETPEETAIRKRHRKEAFTGICLILGGLLIMALFHFNLNSLLAVSALLSTFIGLLLLITALISIAIAKQKERIRVYKIRKRPAHLKPDSGQHANYTGPGILAIIGFLLAIVGIGAVSITAIETTLTVTAFYSLLGLGVIGILLLLIALLWGVFAVLSNLTGR